jgi:hypothetical protein
MAARETKKQHTEKPHTEKQHTEKQHTEEKAVRKLTTAELAAIDKFLVRLQAKPSGRFKVSKDGSNWRIGFDHLDQLVGHALVMSVS